MNPLKDVMLASARLAILRFLVEDSDYRLNTSVLQDALTAIGLDMTRAQIDTMCAWLAERDLVSVEMVGAVKVVQLLERGANVASGREQVDGIKRPGPGA